jgi:hypothetical protein
LEFAHLEYLDVLIEMSWFCMHSNLWTSIVVFCAMPFKDHNPSTTKHSTFFKHLQECSQTWNENLMVLGNGIISYNTFTQDYFHFFIEVLPNIYIHHDLNIKIFTNVNKIYY